MALTLEHDRRKRAQEQQANLKAQKDREIDEIIAKAVKSHGIVMATDSPEAQIAALDQYITSLREVGEELELRYGPGIERRLWLIDHEINTAIEAIARLKIEQVSPGK